MRVIQWFSSRLISVIAIAGACNAASAQPRSVEQAVISPADPAARIVIDPSFSYLGRTEASVMADAATAEQFWFARIENGRMTSAVIVHFERWNEGAEGAFRYPTFRMQRLGAHDYLHQSFPMENCPLITADVRALMQSNGISTAQHCVATRFVRATDATLRTELILFYIENVDALPDQTGLVPGGLPAGFDQPSPPDTPWARTDQRLTEGALRALRVID